MTTPAGGRSPRAHSPAGGEGGLGGGLPLLLLSGGLLLLSFPPLHLLLPPLVALVPWGVWLHSLPPDRAGRRLALQGGGVLGGVYFGGLLYWVAYALLDFSWLAVAGYLGIVAVLTLVLACASWAAHRIHHGAGVPIWLALPLAWTGGEWVQAHLGDLDFPWLGLGTSLTGYPELVGVAELVGARGVTFWLALVNGVGAALVVALRTRKGGSRRLAMALAVVCLLPAGWGVWRAGTLETVPAARVAVAQPNISQALRRSPEAATDSTFRALERLFQGFPRAAVDLVVWPEVALLQPLGFPAFRSAEERVEAFARGVGAPVLLGAFGAELLPDGEPIFFNSAFLVHLQGVDRSFRYDKRHLVFPVERSPSLVPGRIRDLLRWVGVEGMDGRGGGGRVLGNRGLAPGVGWPLAEAGGVRFGVVICFESAFAGTVRMLRREGADVLVNLTNDGWFGGDAWYTRTTAIWQHPSHLVMRAIENRMGVARSANTGISLFVDPVGRVHDTLGFGEAGVAVAEVRTTRGMTLYTRTGDLAGPGSVAAILLLLGLASVRGRREPPRVGGVS